MPRNGSGVYSKPAGTTAVPNTPIESTKYNETIDDLAEDANTARPTTAGGTGSGTVAGARANLGVDQAKVLVKKSANYTAVAADKNAHIRFNGAYTLTLTAAATLGGNWFIGVQADGGEVTIDPNASETINGGATFVVPDGSSTFIYCDGSTFFAEEDFLALATKVDVGVAQAFTPAQQAQGRANISAALKGHTFGLALTTNASDAANDIDIAVGEAASGETDPVLMVLSTALTKRIDAGWSVGSGQGGLDTGTVGDNVYHIWLIQRSDTSDVDALFSLSSTSPTLPTSYDRKRLLGMLVRTGGANGPITAYDKTPFFFRSAGIATTSGTAFDFAIDPDATEIIVDLGQVQLSGTDTMLVQLGTAGGFVVTGYDGGIYLIVPGSSAILLPTTGFAVSSNATTRYANGSLILRRVGASTRWVAHYASGTNGDIAIYAGGGSVDLGAAVTQLRLTRSGSNTFVAGIAGVEYRT